jgi:hypothetical protein
VIADPCIDYTGERLRYLHFQCLQILLRKQVRVLIDRCGCPEELEVRGRGGDKRGWALITGGPDSPSSATCGLYTFLLHLSRPSL